jgi:4-diphosphocytidyl-2-C-methyl-D-erythritol kinase
MTVAVRAPARLSVYARVGKAHRDGYHAMATLFQAISLYDEVTAEPSDRDEIDFIGPVNAAQVPRGPENIALRAARLLADKTGVQSPVKLTVFKRIPLGGGLGGASADAAAALVACNALWRTQVPRAQLFDYAEELGAEVPFALSGGTAIWTAEGDTFNPALSKGSYSWVLAFSERGWKAPVMFETLDSHRVEHEEFLGKIPQTVDIDTGVIQAIRQGDASFLADVMHNDLQVAAMKLSPRVREILELGESRGALAGIVCATGSTVAFLTSSSEQADRLRRVLVNAGVETMVVTGPVSGARRIDVPPTHAFTAPIPIR